MGSECGSWPSFHYTLSRPAWWRRWIVWRHMPLRRISGDVFEWEIEPSMRFWSYEQAAEIVWAFNAAKGDCDD